MTTSNAPDVPGLAVVGAGWWSSTYHLPALADTDRARLVAVVDTDAARRERAARAHEVPAFASLGDLAAAGLADGVLVTVPHEAHHAVTAEALEAGLHVFLEKPMALDAGDAWDLVARAERSGRHLMLGYTHQVTRLAARLRTAIADGELGELLHVAGLSATMLRSVLAGTPEDYDEAFGHPEVPPSAETYSQPGSGGQAWSQLTHGTGFVCYVTDLQPELVGATMGHGGLEVDITDAITVRFDSGTTATLSSTATILPGQPEQHEYRFYGSDGYALVDLVAGTLAIHRGAGAGHDVEHLELGPGENCPPLEPARRFADVIAGTAENPAPPIPAARAVEIIQGAHRSHTRGEMVVVADLGNRA